MSQKIFRLKVSHMLRGSGQGMEKIRFYIHGRFLSYLNYLKMKTFECGIIIMQEKINDKL